MANEITIQVAMNRVDSVVTNNRHNIPQTTVRATQSTKRHVDITKTVGTTEESIVFSTLDIGTNGLLLMQNLDATNYVNWGTTTTDYPGTILAGETAGPFRLTTGKDLFLKANTAACDVRIVMYAA